MALIFDKIGNIIKVLLILLIGRSVQDLYAQKNVAPNYVITHQKDTLVIDKINYTDSRWNDLSFTLTLSDGSKKIVSGKDVWRFKETRNGKIRLFQVARIVAKRRINYKVLRLHLSGKLDLMYDTSMNLDWPFISGEGFNDFVTEFQNFKKLKALLDECDAFKEAYTTTRSKSYKNLEQMIHFYNQNCGKAMAHELGHTNFSSCIFLTLSENGYVIKNQKELEDAIRKDASQDYCLEKLPQIDWKQYLLVGNSIRSGSCYRPTGLTFNHTYSNGSNTIYLDIFYHENQPLCRALSRYNYWLLLPKPNENVEVITRYNTIDNP